MKEATRVFQTSKENLWSGDDILIYWTAAEQQTVRSLEAGSEHDRQPTGKISYCSVKWTGWSSWLYRISFADHRSQVSVNFPLSWGHISRDSVQCSAMGSWLYMTAWLHDTVHDECMTHAHLEWSQQLSQVSRLIQLLNSLRVLTNRAMISGLNCL